MPILDHSTRPNRPPYAFIFLLLSHLRKSFGGQAFIIILLSFILFTGCPKDPPEPDPRDTSIFLELEKTWTTSLTFKISVADTSDNWNFSLSRDDSSVGLYEVAGADTLIVDNGLEPDREYRYRAYWLQEGTARDSSNEVIAVTMDTTSHNFFWNIDTLGYYGSYLNDVAIIDENNIWVVGYIKLGDSTYNAAHWDGSEWELIKIQPQGYVQPLRTVFYFSNNNIWFGQSTLPIQWNGEEYYLYTPANDGYPGGSIINAIWASAPDDIYFVGSGGGIVHYDGVGFNKIEDTPNVNLKGISGTSNGSHIFIVGRDNYYPAPSILLELSNNSISTMILQQKNGHVE